MRTAETLRRVMTIDLAIYRAFRKLSAEQMKALLRIYKMTENVSPKATAEILAYEIGRAEANSLVASLVNSAYNDGRYSPPVEDWAASVDTSNDGEAANMLGIYTDKIPPANINQIALALMAHRQG